MIIFSSDMKSRLIIGILIAVLAVVSLHTQVSMISKAEAQDAPITSPISYFNVSGKALYNFFGRFIPATNARITALNTQDRSIISVKTDSNGLYSLALRQAEYIISAQDLFEKTIFAPAHYKLFVASDLPNINFVGILN